MSSHPIDPMRRGQARQWTRRLLQAGVALATLLVATARATPVFLETACDIPVADAATHARLRCGSVTVPRDPGDVASSSLDLAVVIRRSASPRPGAAPVLILHGGPGGEQTRFMGMSADDFAAGRDSIAFDMRGGGRSGPALCRELPGALLAATQDELEGDDAGAARNSALVACADEFATAGFAPAHFGTGRNVEDAEAVRLALGIERWAVYGMSYGTTVAAEYLAHHPAVIESVVLDSLYPPDAFVPSVREAQGRAIARLLGECAADAACAARFPGLDRARADAALAALAEAPLSFHIDGRRYQADESAVRRALHGLFYQEATARAVPWFLDALVRGDGEAIAAVLGLPVIAGEQLISSGSMAALFATDCRDRPRHHVPAAGPGPSWMAMFSGIADGACRAWPLGTPPGLPTGNRVPVLVLAAGYDGFQPDAEAVASAIGPAATALTIPLAAHVVRGAGQCPRAIVAGFINDPSQAPDTACLAAMQAPPFVLDARPLPAAVGFVAAIGAGRPPAPALAAIAGVALLLVAGVLVPAAGWLWRRRSRAPAVASGARGLRAMAVSGGLLGVAGALLPVAGTLLDHPGAAAFGLEPTLALGLWALPAGAALSLLALLLALRRGQCAVAAAALGGVFATGGLLLLGLLPWA